MRAPPTIAVLGAFVVVGCYASHGAVDEPRLDAGRIGDAPRPIDTATLDSAARDVGPSECSIDPGVIVGLECPATVRRGESITVDVRVHMLGCCDVSAPAGTTARSVAPDSWEIEAPYSVCRCCEMCLCEPVVSTRSVTLVPATGDRVRVQARELSCDIAVIDDECRLLRADTWMAPRHVATGEPIAVRMVHDTGVSCGCTPRTLLSTPRGPELSFLACGCSDLDPCVDPGYEATAIAAGPDSESEVQFFHPYPGGRVIVHVHDLDRCAIDLESLDSVVLAAPDESLIAERPRALWLELRGTRGRCCGEPALVVEHADDPVADVRLVLHECAPDPCDCSIPRPVDFVEHHFVGFRPPGVTSVRAGGRIFEFDLR